MACYCYVRPSRAEFVGGAGAVAGATHCKPFCVHLGPRCSNTCFYDFLRHPPPRRGRRRRQLHLHQHQHGSGTGKTKSPTQSHTIEKLDENDDIPYLGNKVGFLEESRGPAGSERPTLTLGPWTMTKWPCRVEMPNSFVRSWKRPLHL